jgi:two-component system nitrate/nitrite response regulator NarL
MLQSPVSDGDAETRDRRGLIVQAIIASDVRLLCDSLQAALRDDPAIDVTALAGSAEDLLEQVAALPSAVVVLDVSMPRALDASRAIVHRTPETKIVAVSAGPDVPSIVACAEAGAAGYVSQDATLPELRATLLEVAAGRTPCSPVVAAGLFRRLAHISAERDRLPAAPPRLTEREYEVLRLVQRGLSNKDIAARLNIALPTAKNHVHRIITKLDVDGRGAAADWLRR